MQAGARVRSIRDGQIGFLVETEEGPMGVRLDRKAEQRIVPYHASEWVPDKEPRLTSMQMARVTFAADTALRLVMGEYGLPEWNSVKEQARLAWLKGLPVGATKVRTELYAAILKVLAR